MAHRQFRPNRLHLFTCLFLIACRPMPLTATAPTAAASHQDEEVPSDLTNMVDRLNSLRNLQQARPFAGLLRNATSTSSTPVLSGALNPLSLGSQIGQGPLGAFIQGAAPGAFNLMVPPGMQNITGINYESVTRMMRNPFSVFDAPDLSPEVRSFLESGDPEVATTVGITSGAFFLTSSILFTVSSSLGIGAASNGFLSGVLDSIMGPYGFLLDAGRLAIRVGSTGNNFGKNAQDLWTTSLLNTAAALKTVNAGGMRTQIASYIDQMASVKGLMASATGRS